MNRARLDAHAGLGKPAQCSAQLSSELGSGLGLGLRWGLTGGEGLVIRSFFVNLVRTFLNGRIDEDRARRK